MTTDFETEYYKSEIKRLELELEKEKGNKKMSTQEISEITEMIELASSMRALLQECRYAQLDMNLAKRIDAVLRRASYLD